MTDEEEEGISRPSSDRDTTDRNECERELERTTALLSTLFDALPHGVLVEDESRNVLRVNSRLFELFEMPGTPEEVIGADCERMAQDVSGMFVDSERFVERINESIAEREPIDEEELVLADGRTFERAYRPIELPTGNGHLWVYRDRTDRKEREGRLEEFTQIVSHDLRNPLSVAEAHLEMAREREERTSEHLAAVEQAHERMDALIADLLTLAREGAADDRRPVSIASIVNDCWATVETADATLVTEIDRTVRAEESRLKQLFENLIRNAIEHGGENVTVRVGEVADGFYVEDDGPGIPERDRDAVFEAGYSTSADGTGFGLSIVEQVVDAHDWELRLDEGPDGGARFEITAVESLSTE